MTKLTLTRREMARQTLIGTLGALLGSAFSLSALPQAASAQVVDPLPTVPPPPGTHPTQNAAPMTPNSASEGGLLTQLVPAAAGYDLSDTQTEEVALQLKDYPGGFAKARAYALPDDVGPAFAADAPPRKERVK